MGVLLVKFMRRFATKYCVGVFDKTKLLWQSHQSLQITCLSSYYTVDGKEEHVLVGYLNGQVESRNKLSGVILETWSFDAAPVAIEASEQKGIVGILLASGTCMRSINALIDSAMRSTRAFDTATRTIEKKFSQE